jgi:hypothetical protein
MATNIGLANSKLTRGRKPGTSGSEDAKIIKPGKTANTKCRLGQKMCKFLSSVDWISSLLYLHIKFYVVSKQDLWLFLMNGKRCSILPKTVFQTHLQYVSLLFLHILQVEANEVQSKYI